jgi:hypothetical protein
MILAALLLYGAIGVLALGWNRCFKPVPARVVLLFCLLVGAYLGPALFTRAVEVPGRILYSSFPWRALGRPPVRANTGIVVTQLVPWTVAARRELLAGRLPLWNRTAAAGAPLLANQQTAIFHPFTLLGLLLPIGKAWTVSAGLRLFCVLFFQFVLLRGWNLSAGAALFGAVAYGFSSFHLVWLLFPVGLATMCLPIALVGVDELLRRPRWRAALLLISGLAASVLGGHPESAAFVALTTGAYALYVAAAARAGGSWREAARRLAAAAAAALAAALLTSPFWLPTLALLPATDRYRAFSSEQSNPPDHHLGAAWLLPLLAPNILGTVPAGTYRAPPPHQPSLLDDYGEIASGYAGIIALGLAVGALAALAPLAPAAGKESPPAASGRLPPFAFFLGAAVVAFLTISEAPVWYPLLRRLPLVGIALHQRLRFLWDLGVSGLAALGLDGLVRRAAGPAGLADPGDPGDLRDPPAPSDLSDPSDSRAAPARRRVLVPFAGLAGAGAAVIAVMLVRRNELASRGLLGFEWGQVGVSMTVLATFAALAAVATSGARRRIPAVWALRRLGIAAALLTCGELCFLTWHYNPPAGPEDIFPVTGAIAALQGRRCDQTALQGRRCDQTALQGRPCDQTALGAQRATLPYRIAASGRAFPPDIPGYYGLEDIKTTDPIHDSRYAHLLRELLGVRANDYNQQIRDPAAPFFDFLNVRYVYSPPRRPLALAWCKPIYSGADGTVCQNLHALPRYFLAAHYEVEPSFAAAVQRLAARAELRSTAIVERLPRRFAALPGFPLPAAPASSSPAPARADLPAGTLRLLAYDGQGARLAAAGGGFKLLVSSDVDWPGWQVDWNGMRLPPVRVNGAFLGCFLPPGPGVLTLRYRPDELTIAAPLAAGTAALLLALSLARLGRRRIERSRDADSAPARRPRRNGW